MFDEEKIIATKSGNKKAKTISALDTIENKKVFFVSKEKTPGQTAVCNLASINLGRVNSFEDIKRVVKIAVNMLDNVIDINFYPVRKTKVTNLSTRAIGLGVMGEAQMLAQHQIKWGSQEHFKKIDTIMEAVSYEAIDRSCELAKIKGEYPLFKGSNWSKGIMPFDHANTQVQKLVKRDLFDSRYDWNSLRAKVKKYGLRNGYLMAIAPTSSISILVGTTQAIEPVYKKKWFEENLSGLIPVVVPNLSPDTWEYYTSAYDVDQLDIIKAAAIRQKWIDQGQSLNVFVSLENVTGKYLSDIYMLAWKLGLKSTYYLRGQSVDSQSDIQDKNGECSSCQ